MRTRDVLGIWSAGLLTACGGVGSPSANAGPGTPADVASVRLFDRNGADLTAHMPVIVGDTLRVTVRMYRVDGGRITEVTGGAELDFTFAPLSVASSRAVEGEPLARDVTSSAANETHGTVTVSLLFLADSSTKTFGPFDGVLVHVLGGP